MKNFQLLLIEDNEIDVRIIKEVAASISKDMSVTHLSSGDDALKLFKNDVNQSFDLIVMDLGLPGTDGKTLLAALRKNPFWAETPVIILTGSTKEDDLQAVENLGARSFLSKSPTPSGHYSLNLKSLMTSWLEFSNLKGEECAGLDGIVQRKILLVEDNSTDALIIAKRLEQQGLERYQVHHESTLDAGIKTLQTMRFDAAILDLSLPDSDGLDTVKSFMKVAGATPVVVLTGSENELGIEAIKLGAQDYLMKRTIDWPRLGRTLAFAIARKSVLPSAEAPGHFEYSVKGARVRVNVVNQSVSIMVEEVEKSPRLTPLEFKLVSFLLQNCGEVVSRNRLLEELWPENSEKPNPRIVDAVVSSVKKKSSLFSEQIETVYGTGYKLKAQ